MHRLDKVSRASSSLPPTSTRGWEGDKGDLQGHRLAVLRRDKLTVMPGEVRCGSL